MKKIILLILFAIATIAVACSTIESEPYDYICDRPADIPETLSNGKEVYWDCDWQSSYKEGLVKVKYNDDGTASLIYRSKAQ